MRLVPVLEIVLVLEIALVPEIVLVLEVGQAAGPARSPDAGAVSQETDKPIHVLRESS